MLISYTETKLATSDITQAWARSAGADNYALIDDPVATPDDDATYIEAVAAEKVDVYGIISFSLPLRAIITSVNIYARSKRVTAGGTCPQVPLLRVDGTNYLHSTQYDLGGSAYTDFNRSWTTNPSTAAAWTVEDINGTGSKPLQGFGIKNVNVAGDTVRCTQIYLEVAYQMPKGGVILCY